MSKDVHLYLEGRDELLLLDGGVLVHVHAGYPPGKEPAKKPLESDDKPPAKLIDIVNAPRVPMAALQMRALVDESSLALGPYVSDPDRSDVIVEARRGHRRHAVQLPLRQLDDGLAAAGDGDPAVHVVVPDAENTGGDRDGDSGARAGS